MDVIWITACYFFSPSTGAAYLVVLWCTSRITHNCLLAFFPFSFFCVCASAREWKCAKSKFLQLIGAYLNKTVALLQGDYINDMCGFDTTNKEVRPS